MSEYKLKPSRWYYLLAFLIPVFTCLVTAIIIYISFPELPGALDDLDIKNLTQVVVPGSADIHFPESGAYAVYYEYRSVIDGVSYYGDEYPISIRCQLRSKGTGENIKLDYSTVEGDIYTFPTRAGVMFKRISIDQPGVYNFSCLYTDGRTYPKIVMAVGPNLILEFFNVALKPIAAMLCGIFAFVSTGVISMLIIAVVAFKRHKAKATLASN
jgi:hypothetical protein